MDEQHKQDDAITFSLGFGGPLYQLGLQSSLLRKPFLLIRHRTLALGFLAWLPLFILALITGVAVTGVDVPFIYDIDVHVRFLLGLPLLIYAELIAHERLQAIVRQFVKCEIIYAEDRQKFYDRIASVKRFTNSLTVEVILAVFVVTAGHWISRHYFPMDVSTWYATTIDQTTVLSASGYWYAYISLPLFQFILLRWYYRMGLWYRFLWQISRFRLRLNSLHPDRAGGLGFLADSLYAFEPFLLAHSVLLSGIIFNRIWNMGATLSQFQFEVISIMVLLMILPLTPMLFFSLMLANTKRTGTLEYDVVANKYVNYFRKKWIESPTTESKEILGAPDIQSLADLTNSFTVSAEMRIVPFGRRSILIILVITMLPMIPLVITMIPLDKILYKLVGIVF